MGHIERINRPAHECARERDGFGPGPRAAFRRRRAPLLGFWCRGHSWRQRHEKRNLGGDYAKAVRRGRAAHFAGLVRARSCDCSGLRAASLWMAEAAAGTQVQLGGGKRWRRQRRWRRKGKRKGRSTGSRRNRRNRELSAVRGRVRAAAGAAVGGRHLAADCARPYVLSFCSQPSIERRAAADACCGGGGGDVLGYRVSQAQRARLCAPRRLRHSNQGLRAAACRGQCAGLNMLGRCAIEAPATCRPCACAGRFLAHVRAVGVAAASGPAAASGARAVKCGACAFRCHWAAVRAEPQRAGGGGTAWGTRRGPGTAGACALASTAFARLSFLSSASTAQLKGASQHAGRQGIKRRGADGRVRSANSCGCSASAASAYSSRCFSPWAYLSPALCARAAKESLPTSWPALAWLLWMREASCTATGHGRPRLVHGQVVKPQQRAVSAPGLPLTQPEVRRACAHALASFVMPPPEAPPPLPPPPCPPPPPRPPPPPPPPLGMSWTCMWRYRRGLCLRIIVRRVRSWPAMGAGKVVSVQLSGGSAVPAHLVELRGLGRKAHGCAACCVCRYVELNAGPVLLTDTLPLRPIFLQARAC